MAKQLQKPPKTWGWWDKSAEGLGWLITVPFLPLVAVGRGFSQIGQRGKVAELRREHHQTYAAMYLASRLPVEFLEIYLARLDELYRQYRTTKWHSLEEAELGYELLKQAEAALITEAEKVAAGNKVAQG